MHKKESGGAGHSGMENRRGGSNEKKNMINRHQPVRHGAVDLWGLSKG